MRLLLLSAFSISAFAQGLSVTPNPASVTQGQSLTFTSNQPVTWGMIPGSAGSLQALSPTTAIYTAPRVVQPQGLAAGCQTTPSDSVFNTRIDNLPVEARSSQWTAAMTSTVPLLIAPDFSVNVVDAQTPQVKETFNYTPQNNAMFPRTDLATRSVQVGSYQTDLIAGSADKHAIYVDPRSCTFYEAYKQFLTARTGPSPYCRTAGQTCTAMSGVSYPWSSYALPTGTTQASNLLYLPTMIRAQELHQASIQHALEFTYNLGGVKGGTSYWPANSTLGCAAAVCPNSPPYGARFRLKASIDISKFSPVAQTILRALQQYGMFLSDVGSGGAVVYADTDTTEDPALLRAFTEIANARLLMGSFEAIDESSFIVSPKSMQVNPANPYQAPPNFAALSATPATGSALTLPIALGSQAPGVPSPNLVILAGTPAYQLNSWAGGTTNAMLEWQLVSGPGSVTRDGVYTAPASIAAPTPAVLQLVPCASPGVVAQVNLTVLPASPDADHAIRIDAGSSTPTTSAGGTKHWLPDVGFQDTSSALRGDYPKWLNQTDPDINIYQTFHYTAGDLSYSFILPNGNYRVRLMQGAPYNGHSTATTYDPNTYWSAWGPYHVVVNGQILAHNYDFGLATGHRNGVTSDIVVPAMVTDNRLVVSIRGNRPDSQAGLPAILSVLEGLEIVPDTAAPFLTIDSQQKNTVAGSNTLQLYAIGWYMDNAVQWNLVSSPGTIDANGLYTAPAATDVDQQVTIQASSLSGRAAATITLTIPAQ